MDFWSNLLNMLGSLFTNERFVLGLFTAFFAGLTYFFNRSSKKNAVEAKDAAKLTAKDAATLHIENQELKKEVADMRKQLAEVAQTNASLASSVLRLSQENEVITLALSKTKAELDTQKQLNAELQSKMQDFVELQSRMQEFERRAAMSNSETAALHAEIASLKAQLAEKTALIAHLQIRINELENTERKRQTGELSQEGNTQQ